MKNTLLVCAALLGAATLVQAQFNYTDNGDGTCTITGYTGPAGAVTIPVSINLLDVVSIGAGAFYQCLNLTSVTIPNGVTSIGGGAFENCYNLTSVTLGDGVTSIGAEAFLNCGLTSVTIGSGVTSIGYWAFAFCNSLTAITVDATNSFYSSSNGVLFDKNQTTLIQFPAGQGGSYTIPDSVTNIGDRAFFQCYRLTSVTIPGGVTSIGAYAFKACSNLIAITVNPANSFYRSVDGVLFDKNQTTLIGFPGGRGGSYTVPASITNIGDRAFFQCYSLTSVTIDNGVTSIGDQAFWDCRSLTNITIGSSVNSIGYGAFYDCTNLTSVTIPDSVTSIGDVAFNHCTSLSSVTIGSGVTDIGYYAFGYCTGLSKVTIPDRVTSISDFAFYSCPSLTSVTLPGSVTTIGNSAFADCTSLTHIIIPAGVTSIGPYAFYDCDSLTAAYFLGNAPPDDGSLFVSDLGADPVIVYYLPGATGWGPFFSGLPTELWSPQASAMRVTGGHFGFDINGPSNTIIVVEACTNPAHPVWLPVSTNSLDGGGASSFTDSQSANYPARFYRFRSP